MKLNDHINDQETVETTVETATESTATQELTAEELEAKQVAEFEKITAQLASEGKKLIAFEPLTDRLAHNLFLALEDLVALKRELTEKATAAAERNQIIKNRLNYLVEEKKMKLNTAHYQSFDESITTYIDLLKKITEEVEGEVLNSARYVSQTPPQFVVGAADEPDNFHDHVSSKIRWIKRHAKNIRKDLSISFSRYEISFAHQGRQLDMLEVLAKQARPVASTEAHDHAHDDHDHAHATPVVEKQPEQVA